MGRHAISSLFGVNPTLAGRHPHTVQPSSNPQSGSRKHLESRNSIEPRYGFRSARAVGQFLTSAKRRAVAFLRSNDHTLKTRLARGMGVGRGTGMVPMAKCMSYYFAPGTRMQASALSDEEIFGVRYKVQMPYRPWKCYVDIRFLNE